MKRNRAEITPRKKASKQERYLEAGVDGWLRDKTSSSTTTRLTSTRTVRKWLAHHPRWTFFTPTSCSWLNAVEGSWPG